MKFRSNMYSADELEDERQRTISMRDYAILSPKSQPETFGHDNRAHANEVAHT